MCVRCCELWHLTAFKGGSGAARLPGLFLGQVDEGGPSDGFAGENRGGVFNTTTDDCSTQTVSRCPANQAQTNTEIQYGRLGLS